MFRPRENGERAKWVDVSSYLYHCLIRTRPKYVEPCPGALRHYGRNLRLLERSDAFCPISQSCTQAKTVASVLYIGILLVRPFIPSPAPVVPSSDLLNETLTKVSATLDRSALSMLGVDDLQAENLKPFPHLCRNLTSSRCHPRNLAWRRALCPGYSSWWQGWSAGQGNRDHT